MARKLASIVQIASCCVPECVYRGFCPEFKPCGFCGTAAWQKAIEAYRDNA